MKISNNGLELIKKFEGCRLCAYKDSGGVLTIGYGHTRGVKLGQKITQKQADAFLLEDVKRAETQVNKYMHVYNFNQNEYDALCSFAYNIGSIKQLTANGSRSKKTISNKIVEYCKCNGKVLNGLQKRRKAEQKLFLTPLENKYFKRCSKSTKTITLGLKEIGVDSSYSYRKKIASVNGFVNYSGKYEENVKMLLMLKNGQLVKP